MVEANQATGQTIENKFPSFDSAKYESLTGDAKMEIISAASGIIRMGLFTVDCNENFSTKRFRQEMFFWGKFLPQPKDSPVWREMNAGKAAELSNIIPRYNNWNNQTELAKMSPKGIAEKEQVEEGLKALVTELEQLHPEVKIKVDKEIQERIDAGVL
jgi:hypothetical protein